MKMLRHGTAILMMLTVVPFVGGCFLIKKPDKTNIALRKQNQEQQARIAELERKTAGDEALIRSLQEKKGSLPTLPIDRLKKLVVTHDLQIFPLTGGADLDPAKPGQEGLKIHIAPIDETGDAIKAAGVFTVEAFDLSRGEGFKIGTWTFDLAATRQAWTSVLNRYNYVLTCPWQGTTPASADLHLEVKFVDELTQAEFKKSADVKVESPPAPTTAPAAN